MLIRRIVILLVFTLVGCASLKPEKVMHTRQAYNEVARNTENEQLLTNIVRLRYSEDSYFLKMTSITTSYSLSTFYSANPSLFYTTGGPGSAWTLSRSLGLNSTLNYSDSPTLSYMPIEDSAFAKQIQTPLTLAQVLIPYNSSVGNSEIADFVYFSRIIFDQVGNISNAGTLSSNKILRVPAYKDFYVMLDLISHLWQRDQLEIRQTVVQNINMISLHFYSEADSKLPEAIKLKKMLNVPRDSDVIYLSDSINPCAAVLTGDPFSPDSKKSFRNRCKPLKVVHVESRSILEIGRFLSFAVQVPEADIKAGYVVQVKYPDGTLFNTAPLFRGLLTILSSDNEPSDVYVKVYDHHHWFYIKNSDTDSKITFTFIQHLMTLIAGTQGTTQNSQPVLTLPVAR